MVVALILASILVAAVLGWRAATRQLQGTSGPYETRRQPGWVYFLTDADDDEGLIKVGFTRRNPNQGRLHEIQSMSPRPLRVLHTIYCEHPEEVESYAHKVLLPHRHHGEWYERDAVLALLSHLKGES